MNKKRLLKLADFLESIPRKAFDLHTIRNGPKENKNISPQEAIKCGTTGCAIGWCPLLFPKLCKIKSSGWGYVEIVTKNRNNSFTAADQIFGLCGAESSYLFDPYSYRKGHRGPRSVATRIRDFVKRNGKISHESKAWTQGYYS